MSIKASLKTKLWQQKYRNVKSEDVCSDIKNQIYNYFEKNKKFAKVYANSISKNLKKWKLYQDDMYRDPKDVYDSFVNQMAYFYYEKYLTLYGSNKDVVDLISAKTIIFQQNWWNEISKRLLDGKGLIFVTGHYGAYEVLPVLLACYGLGVTVITEPTMEKPRTDLMGTGGHFKFISPSEPIENIFNSAKLALANNECLVVFCDEFSLWEPSPEIVNFLGKEFNCDKFIDELQNVSEAQTVFTSLRRLSLDPTKSSRYLMKLSYDLGQSPQRRALEFLSAEVLRNPEQYMYWDQFDGNDANKITEKAAEKKKKEEPKKEEPKGVDPRETRRAGLRGGSHYE